MKKYLLTISAMMLLLVAGCEMFPEDESIAAVEGKVPSITVSDVKDNSFTVTITPAEGTGFYACLITDTPPKNITGSGLLGVSYEGLYAGNTDTETFKIVASASNVIVNDNTDKPAVTFSNNSGVQKGTKYYIYAAGASEQGIASEVVSETVWTTDPTEPDLSKAKITATDTSVVVAMNTVMVWDTTKNVTYTVYDAAGNKVENMADVVMTTRDSLIAVDGKTITFTIPDTVRTKISGKDAALAMPAGALVAINWAEGAFTNSAEKPVAAKALSSTLGKGGVDAFTLYEREGIYGEGIVYRVPSKAWNLVYETYIYNKKNLRKGSNMLNITDQAKFVGVTGKFVPSADKKSVLAENVAISTGLTIADGGYVTLTSVGDNGETSKKVEFDYSKSFSLDSLVTVSGMSVNKGEMTSITIPAASLFDKYRNPNAEFKSNSNFVDPIGTDDKVIAGTYTLTADIVDVTDYTPVEVANLESKTVTVTVLDEKDVKIFANLPCNVVITGLLYNDTEKLYGVYYPQTGQLHIPANQTIKLDAEEGTAEGYYDYNADPDKNGKYPLLKFKYDVKFDAPDHSAAIFKVNGNTISSYNSKTTPYNSEWNTVVYDGQQIVINPWYRITNTVLTK